MIRRAVLVSLLSLFLFWLLWPRAWLPSGASAVTALEIRSPNDELLADARDFSAKDAVILLLAPEHEAFASARVLRAAGVPFIVTRDLLSAITHHMIVVPAGEHTLRLPARDRARLGAFVAGGGTIVFQATGVIQLLDLTGVSGGEASRRRRRINFTQLSDDGFRYLTRPELREIRLASDAIEEGFWTSSLRPRGHAAEPIARFDGTRDAAILRRRIGLGSVYTLGLDLRDVFVRPQTARHFDAWSSPTEQFQPGADVWPLIFRAWYEDAVPEWARLRSLPGESSGLLLLSHSLESGDSPTAAREWAAWESSHSVHSTWFVQTNDSDGGQPGPFYDAAFTSTLRALAALGHELAAHTVTHPETFDSLPTGSALERRRDYRPMTDGGSLWDATMMGELRVPKEILEKDVPGIKVLGSRAPFLQYPPLLDEMLAASGYSWDSSLSSGQVLTHRPFLMTRRRTMTREGRVVELPMTIQDEVPSRRPPLEAADVLRVIRQVSEEEGVVVWQSRPRAENERLEASVLSELPAGTAIGSMGETALWWLARERTRFRLEPGPALKQANLRVFLPPEADGVKVSFELYAPIRACSSGTPGLSYSCQGHIVTLYGTGGAREAALALQFENLDAPEPRGVPRP